MRKSMKVLIFLSFGYLLMVGFQVPFLHRTGKLSWGSRPEVLGSEENVEEKAAPNRPRDRVLEDSKPERRIQELQSHLLSNVAFNSDFGDDGFANSAASAFASGKKLWRELESKKEAVLEQKSNRTEKCPDSVSISGAELSKNGNVVEMPCGLAFGSYITVVGRPKLAHRDTDSKISLPRKGQVLMVSQFMLELQGLKTVDGEEPPKILHFNPRLKGDFSGKPVIELNTCYRMQWGIAQRCEGLRSRNYQETVDGNVKCENWIRDDNDDHSKQLNSGVWKNSLMGLKERFSFGSSFPFSEEKLFVLTVTAGIEGYHINVDGKHVASFPYRTGFTLEDATGLSLNGDIDVQSVYATSLPTLPPNLSLQENLDLSERWKALPIPDQPVELFVGVISAGNHFAERMAIRMSWMQHRLIKSSNVAARFFVALHSKNEVNEELKKEAEFFGDIVIVPYMDSYDLVVLKTVAISEYAVHIAHAKAVMKCDDDTFVRLEAVLDEAKKVADSKSFYIGNINYYHKPMRSGKWAVAYEEWTEEVYPPYADGPGYIVSSDIAHFIVSEYEKYKLKLFKMEDVSMGMWVEKFNNTTKPVKYIHSLKFCQSGCIKDYYTAHYQSPRQMMCLWKKLQKLGKPLCCNMR